MATGSPSVYLLWSILAVTFQVFLVIHLWCYDRFQCVRWNSGRQPGAFKRVMTYSYLATLPMLTFFAIAMTVLKYNEDYIMFDNHVIAKPLELWSANNKGWVLGLYVVFAIAWSLEIVTHLEELTFWLFLLHQGPRKRLWFQSWEFRVWYLGSIIAILGMPLTVLVRRHDLETCLAWIFIGGSSAGLLTTICFVYVLIKFPAFIRHVKGEGAEPDVIVRLSMFYQLNIARVVFRFLYVFSPLILAADALRGPVVVATNCFASDFLLMVTGIGCFVSSAITLLIFFPRSVTRESGFRPQNPSPAQSTKSRGVGASPLPDYTRDPRSPYSPKTEEFYDDAFIPPDQFGRAPPFRFPGDDDASDTSSLQRPPSIRSHDDEASPRYECDAEESPSFPPSVQTSVPSLTRGSGSDSIPDSAPMSRTNTSRGAKRRVVVEPPVTMKIHKPKVPWHEAKPWRQYTIERDHQRGSLVKAVYDKDDCDLEDGRQLSYLHGQELNPPPPPPTPDIHPYVMNFTSPIDLLDAVDHPPGTPRAI